MTASNPILGVKRQKIAPGFLLAAIEHVALIFGDDQRQTRNLGGEIAQFDAAKIGERNVRPAIRLASAAG